MSYCTIPYQTSDKKPQVTGSCASIQPCDITCASSSSNSSLENPCTTYQLPLYNNAIDKNIETTTCPSVDWTDHSKYVSPSIYSGGTVYYCKDTELTGNASKCNNVQSAKIYNTCNSSWSQIKDLNYGLNYAEYWNPSCDNFAQELVRNGQYKSVACYNQAQTDIDIEWGEYAQAWPSEGYNVSPKDYANNLACQLNPKYQVTECDTLGNLCDTKLFQENFSGAGKDQIIERSSSFAIQTLEGLVEAIGEAL
jgi:hypothetical protein